MDDGAMYRPTRSEIYSANFANTIGVLMPITDFLNASPEKKKHVQFDFLLRKAMGKQACYENVIYGSWLSDGHIEAMELQWPTNHGTSSQDLAGNLVLLSVMPWFKNLCHECGSETDFNQGRRKEILQKFRWFQVAICLDMSYVQILQVFRAKRVSFILDFFLLLATLLPNSSDIVVGKMQMKWAYKTFLNIAIS